VYKDFGATPVTHDDAEYMLVEEKDILATVK
jgi:co-chaperonin GroES (HSP10)